MNTCIHRFRISEQNGNPRVPGTCLHCGEVREFATSEEGVLNWMAETAKRRRKHIVLTRPKDPLAGLGRQPRTTR